MMKVGEVRGYLCTEVDFRGDGKAALATAKIKAKLLTTADALVKEPQGN